MKRWLWGGLAPVASVALCSCLVGGPSGYGPGHGGAVYPVQAAVLRAPATAAIMPTAAIIAPTKASGEPWDVGGSASPLQVSPAQRRALTVALIGSNPMAAIAAELGANALTSFGQNMSMPDVRVAVLVNGRAVGGTSTYQDSPTPSWVESIGPVTTGPADVVQFSFVDADVMFDDPIGTCVTNGQPPIDERGFVLPDALSCSGEVLAFSVRFRDPAGTMFQPPPAPTVEMRRY